VVKTNLVTIVCSFRFIRLTLIHALLAPAPPRELVRIDAPCRKEVQNGLIAEALLGLPEWTGQCTSHNRELMCNPSDVCHTLGINMLATGLLRHTYHAPSPPLHPSRKFQWRSSCYPDKESLDISRLFLESPLGNRMIWCK
jgi:hypothetical protein